MGRYSSLKQVIKTTGEKKVPKSGWQRSVRRCRHQKMVLNFLFKTLFERPLSEEKIPQTRREKNQKGPKVGREYTNAECKKRTARFPI